MFQTIACYVIWKSAHGDLKQETCRKRPVLEYFDSCLDVSYSKAHVTLRSCFVVTHIEYDYYIYIYIYTHTYTLLIQIPQPASL